MEIVQFVADALGDASYLVVSGTEAVVIDPQRDVRPYVAAAAKRGVTITRVFETHVHNDYISGGRELAARGAEIVAPAEAELRFAHRPIGDGEEIAVGAGHIRAVSAPGHTHHHTAYLAVDEAGTVLAAFTGGSIIIGGAGRTDLLGPEHTETLTRLQWDSAHRIAALLPDDAELLPTHGAGSFCSSQQCGGERRAPLAVERQRNIVLATPDYDAFRTFHLANPAPIPSYYRHMAPTNREGPRVFGEPPRPALLTPAGAVRALEGGTPLVDVRDRLAFARAHIPGSISLEEGESMLAFLGWTLPYDSPLVLVTEGAAQADRAAADLLRIGYEEVRGYLPFKTWLAEGAPVGRLDAVDRVQAAGLFAGRKLPIYDVRFESDLRALPLPGATHYPFDRLHEWLPGITDQEMLVVCGGGTRAATVASLLKNAGRRPQVLLDGGAADVLQVLDRGRGHDEPAPELPALA